MKILNIKKQILLIKWQLPPFRLHEVVQKILFWWVFREEWQRQKLVNREPTAKGVKTLRRQQTLVKAALKHDD